MEKRSPYENTEMYTGYEETTGRYISESEKVQMPPRDDDSMYAIQRKRETILTVLMIIPTTICFAVILWTAGVNSMNTLQNNILIAAYPFMSTLLSVIFSVFIVQKVTVIDTGRKILNKHVFHFMGFAAASGIFTISSNPFGTGNILLGGWWRIIPFAIAIGFFVWSFFLYTRFEKKIFIPIMAVTFLCLLFGVR